MENSYNESFDEAFNIAELIPSISTTLTYKSSHTIFEKIVKCTIKSHELNYSSNPTTLIDQTDPFSDINPIFINSEFTPYVTTVGLYNDDNELLAVAKFDYPIKLPENTSITFVIRLDF